MSALVPYVLVSLAFVFSRAVLAGAGLPFGFSLDWMWLADTADLRDRLAETLWYFHAFPPGMDLLTSVAGGESAIGNDFADALLSVFQNSRAGSYSSTDIVLITRTREQDKVVKVLDVELEAIRRPNHKVEAKITIEAKGAK